MYRFIHPHPQWECVTPSYAHNKPQQGVLLPLGFLKWRTHSPLMTGEALKWALINWHPSICLPTADLNQGRGRKMAGLNEPPPPSLNSSQEKAFQFCPNCLNSHTPTIHSHLPETKLTRKIGRDSPSLLGCSAVIVCVELAHSLRVCVGFLPQSKDVRVRLMALLNWP